MTPGNTTIDNVLQDARTLSSGTMAALIRALAVPNVSSGHYEVVERVRRAFASHVEGAGAGRFSTWQEAWADFRATPQAVEAVAGGPVHAEGGSVLYELHFWDGRPKTHHLSLTELDAAFRAAVAIVPIGDDGQLEAVVYRRRGERGLIARAHGHRLSDGRAEVRPLAGWEDAEMEPMAPAIVSALRHAIDSEARRLAVGAVRQLDFGTAMGPMPHHVARILHPEPEVADAPASSIPVNEEVPSCAYRPR